MKNYFYAFIAVFFFFGCAGEQRIIKYYTIDSFTIESPEIIEVSSGQTLPYIVEVADFTVAGSYNDTRIALRTNTNELEYYHFHQWAETPSHAIRYFLWRFLNEARVFEVTQLRMTVSAPHLLVTGSVNKLERVDMDGEAGAYIDGSIELIDVMDNRILVSHRFNSLSPFASNAPMNVFAYEISHILHNETIIFIEKIHDHFNR